LIQNEKETWLGNANVVQINGFYDCVMAATQWSDALDLAP